MKLETLARTAMIKDYCILDTCLHCKQEERKTVTAFLLNVKFTFEMK